MNDLHGFSYNVCAYIDTERKKIGRPRPLINLFLIITRHILSQFSVKHLWGKGNKILRIRTYASKVILGRDQTSKTSALGSCNLEIILKIVNISTNMLCIFLVIWMICIDLLVRQVSWSFHRLIWKLSWKGKRSLPINYIHSGWL